MASVGEWRFDNGGYTDEGAGVLRFSRRVRAAKGGRRRDRREVPLVAWPQRLSEREAIHMALERASARA